MLRGFTFIFFALLSLIFILEPSPAYAYLDPGTGSILLQSTLASIAAAGATITYCWRSLLKYLPKRNKSERVGAEGSD